MSDELRRILSLLCYVIGAVFLGYTAYISLTVALSVQGLMILFFSTALLLFFATALRFGGVKARAQRRRLVRLFLTVCFMLYSFVVINLLFLHNADSLSVLSFFSIKAPNFIPLKSLIGYIGQLIGGSAETQSILIHLLGNLMLYMPLGFFLIALFDEQSKGKFYFPTVLAVLIGLKTLQYSLGFGRFDIDDILLNVLGATFVYLLFGIQSVRRTMKKWYLGDRIRK